MKTVKDVMSSKVSVAYPEMTLAEASKAMKDQDIGFIPVCDGNRLCGTLTDRDIVIRGVASQRDPSKIRVSEVMNRKLVYCFENQNVAEAASLMQKNQVRRVIVLDRDKKLCGIISLGDLSNQTKHVDLQATTLQRISSPNSVRSYFRSAQKTVRQNRAWLSLIPVVAGYLFYRRNQELPEQVRRILPFSRNREQNLLKAS